MTDNNRIPSDAAYKLSDLKGGEIFRITVLSSFGLSLCLSIFTLVWGYIIDTGEGFFLLIEMVLWGLAIVRALVIAFLLGGVFLLGHFLANLRKPRRDSLALQFLEGRTSFDTLKLKSIYGLIKRCSVAPMIVFSIIYVAAEIPHYLDLIAVGTPRSYGFVTGNLIGVALFAFVFPFLSGFLFMLGALVTNMIALILPQKLFQKLMLIEIEASPIAEMEEIFG